MQVHNWPILMKFAWSEVFPTGFGRKSRLFLGESIPSRADILMIRKQMVVNVYWNELLLPPFSKKNSINEMSNAEVNQKRKSIPIKNIFSYLGMPHSFLVFVFLSIPISLPVTISFYLSFSRSDSLCLLFFPHLPLLSPQAVHGR